MTMLTRNVTWQNYGMRGCCGAHTIARLWGQDTTEASRNRAVKRWYNYSKNLTVYDAKGYSLETTLKYLQRGPIPANCPHTKTPLYNLWHGGAVPVHIAFAAVVESMCDQSLIFLADNVDEEGDVHMGLFTTRAFVKWFKENNLGFAITGGPVQSTRTVNNIQGWVLHPNWKRCNTVIKNAKEELQEWIKEMNSDARIKQDVESAYAATANETAELQRTLTGGW